MSATATDMKTEKPESTYGPLRQFFMRAAMTIITAVNLWLLTRSKGRLGFSFLGQSVLLLHTVGRKTGRQYATPLFYMKDDENMVLVASRAGTPVNPGWLRNIEASPDVDVQVRSGTRRVRAHVASSEERERLWPRLTEMFDTWADIQETTSRQFPVIILEPCETLPSSASAA